MNVDIKLNKNKTQVEATVEVAVRVLARDRREECGTKRIKNFLRGEGYDVHDCLKEDYINNFGSGKLVGTWSFSLESVDNIDNKKKVEEEARKSMEAAEEAAAKKKAEETSKNSKKTKENKS